MHGGPAERRLLTRQQRWWLWGAPAAWGASALIVLGATLPATELLCTIAYGGWLWYGWRSFVSARMRDRARRALASLLVLALPLQGIAGVAAEARGPGHFHADASPIPHSHGSIQHHHHAAGSDAIAVEDDGARQAVLASEENKRSGFSVPDAAALTFPVATSQPGAGAIQEGPAAGSELHFPPPHERPPRSS